MTYELQQPQGVSSKLKYLPGYATQVGLRVRIWIEFVTGTLNTAFGWRLPLLRRLSATDLTIAV